MIKEGILKLTPRPWERCCDSGALWASHVDEEGQGKEAHTRTAVGRAPMSEDDTVGVRVGESVMSWPRAVGLSPVLFQTEVQPLRQCLHLGTFAVPSGLLLSLSRSC